MDLCYNCEKALCFKGNVHDTRFEFTLFLCDRYTSDYAHLSFFDTI